MITTFIFAVIFLTIISLVSKNKNKNKHRKFNSNISSIPHATNKLYGPNELNALGIEDPVLNLSETINIPDIRVSSFSNEARNYDVSLSRMRCSCLDFMKTRTHFTKTDPRRACKHLVEQFSDNNLIDKQDELARAILFSPTRGELATFQVENGMVFGLSFEATGWVAVFARSRRKGEKGFLFTGKYEEYGYDLYENR